MKAAGSVAAVIAAVNDEVEAEVERIGRRAADELGQIAQARAEVRGTVPDRERRLAAAHVEARDRVAREDYLDAQALLAARERWMRAVVEAGDVRLEQREDAHRVAVLGRLADEALLALPGEEARVQVAPRDLPLLDATWIEARRRASGKRVVTVDAGAPGGGCVACTPDGRIANDNTFAARRERLEAEWRRELGALFEEAMR